MQYEAMEKSERKPQASITPFGLRMQPGLKAALEAEARAANRSLNAEIVARLELTLESEYFTISALGLEALARRLDASVQILEEQLYFNRDVDLDAFLTDQANAGNVMTRKQAIRHILREYLSSHGYEPPTSERPARFEPILPSEKKKPRKPKAD